MTKFTLPTFFALFLLAVFLPACGGDKEKDIRMTTFRQAETAVVTQGCILEEKDLDKMALDCKGVRTSDNLGLRNRLEAYVAAGRAVLDHDAQNGNKDLSVDDRLRISRKIALATTIRNAAH